MGCDFGHRENHNSQDHGSSVMLLETQLRGDQSCRSGLICSVQQGRLRMCGSKGRAEGWLLGKRCLE